MVSGIRTDSAFTWDEFRRAFASLLPEAKFCVATEPSCNIWEIGRFRDFIRKTAARYDTGEDLLIVGHSLGGVMACAMQPLMKHTHVLGIATIHSPHRFLFGILTHLLGAQHVSAPIITFQGLHDGLVWWGTRHPKSMLHVRNNANHFHDLWEYPENAQLMAGIIVRTFFPSMAAA